MAGKKRYEASKESMRLKAIQLRDEGLTQAEIAKKLKISQATISRDLKVLKTRYIKKSDQATAEHIHREMAVLGYIEKEAKREWERIGGTDDNDPRYLGEIRGVSAQRSKLLGLYQQRIDVTTKDQALTLNADMLAKADQEAAETLEAWEEERFGDDSSG